MDTQTHTFSLYLSLSITHTHRQTHTHTFSLQTLSVSLKHTFSYWQSLLLYIYSLTLSMFLHLYLYLSVSPPHSLHIRTHFFFVCVCVFMIEEWVTEGVSTWHHLTSFLSQIHGILQNKKCFVKLIYKQDHFRLNYFRSCLYLDKLLNMSLKESFLNFSYFNWGRRNQYCLCEKCKFWNIVDISGCWGVKPKPLQIAMLFVCSYF